MAKSKVFITGVAGFLGSHLADALLAAGYEVVGCDNLSGGYSDNVPAGVEFYQGDCLDRDFLSPIIKGTEVVYHCASYAHEGLSVFSPFIVTQNTYGITLAVLSIAAAHKVKRFVYCSSMSRYGTQPILPFTENMTPLPQDPYGIAKYASELSVKNICETQGIEYVIAIPHNIIGARQKYDDPYRNVASIMVNLMLQGRQPIIYGDGEQKRSFSFVKDVVDCLVKMGFQDNLAGETINVGPDEEFVTINVLAKMIAELLNFQLEPIYMPERPREVKLATCNADKARKLLGYKTKVDLKTGLLDIIEYIKERGPKSFTYHIDLEIINDKTPRTWKDKIF
jgi:UDP-glucose 4-epimerase